jgi:hypothetical protein
MMSLRPSVRLSALISSVSVGRIFVKFDTGDFHENMSRNSKFRLNRTKNIGHFIWKPKCFLLLPATFHHHESALLEWNGIRLQGRTRRYKHYANATPPYFTRTLPILCPNCYFWALWVKIELSNLLWPADRPGEQPSLLYNGYQIFPGGKSTGEWRWSPTPSSAQVKKE